MPGKAHESPRLSTGFFDSGWCPSPASSLTPAKKRFSSLGVVQAEKGTVKFDEESIARLCDSGLPDPDVCDVLQLPPRDTEVVSEAWSRGRWLLGLLVLQSMSSFVLDSYQDLLREHLVVTLFLTMLVGAGGNAGNQSAIKVNRGLATGALQPSAAAIQRMLLQQAQVGLLLACGLSAGGWVRVYVTNGSVVNSFAISASLFCIVMTSVLAGTGLPFVLARAGVDPANAGTSIQVIMDIVGCLITCATCHIILDQLTRVLAVG
ncbi:hypothetical protein WJX81_004024 [Elliptochloris bilobata]|uniref:SLC41A/MgtE integral membrane domain-containing protein n=1 Tax=Elliptochloris bilobata TaxID=381761 RepID=A0AAW1QLU1_9CHLO